MNAGYRSMAELFRDPAEGGAPLSGDAEGLVAELEGRPLTELVRDAAALRRQGHGNVISYSRKVFIPLTRLCRDVCGYCTFATTPGRAGTAYLSPDEVLAIAQAGRAAGCR